MIYGIEKLSINFFKSEICDMRFYPVSLDEVKQNLSGFKDIYNTLT